MPKIVKQTVNILRRVYESMIPDEETARQIIEHYRNKGSV